MATKLPFRARNPEATKADILAAARAEFARAGLSGARIEQIAEKSGANKRMIYHYFGSKDNLFAAVVEEAYLDIRTQERELGLESLPPTEAIRRLIEFTWDYYLKHPEFITLVNSENLQKARHIKANEALRQNQAHYARTVADILRRGEASGEFRLNVDPVQLVITIAAVGFYYLNNRHTGSVLFGFDFMDKAALKKRLAFNIDTIMRTLLVPARD